MSKQPFRMLRTGTVRQLVCFHHAGGMAEYFLPWRDGVATDSALYAAQLPGHGARMGETALTCLHQLADQLALACHYLPQRPTFFFGHSMGAALAFEVALRLQRQGRSIHGLGVSGRLPPDCNSDSDYYRQSDRQMLDKLKSLASDDMASRYVPELMTLLLPVFRADFEAIETYQRRDAQRLTCPVFAAVGDHDSEVTPEQMARWGNITDGVFQLRIFAGGHFYLDHQREGLLAFLNREFAAVSVAGIGQSMKG